MELGKLPVAQEAVPVELRPLRPDRGRQRHVLDVGLVRVGAAPQERLGRIPGPVQRISGCTSDVAAASLFSTYVMVPRHDPREHRVGRRLEMGVGLVEGVAIAVVGEVAISALLWCRTAGGPAETPSS